MAFASQEWVKDLLKKVLKKADRYSTDEQVIGSWINGKPIYRKVIVYNAKDLPLSTDTRINVSEFGITGAGDAISVSGYIKNSGGASCYINEPFYFNNLVHIARASINDGVLILQADSRPWMVGENTNWYIIAEYTKTTD